MHSIPRVKFLTSSNCISADVLDFYTYGILENGLTIPQEYFTSEHDVERITGLQCICLMADLLAVFLVAMWHSDECV